VSALGPRPVHDFERARYDRLTDAINRYRVKYAVEGDDPLGPRPFEARARLGYDALMADISGYGRQHARVLEPSGFELGLGR
jgi:hypothetical protein